jgi:hypothetical protein
MAGKQIGGKAETKTVEEKDSRSIYDYSKAVAADGTTTILNEEGKLMEFPGEVLDTEGVVTQPAFNPNKNKPLTKEDFGDKAGYWLHQAGVLELRAKASLELAAKRRADAAEHRKYGDEKTRRKVSKLSAMKAQIAKLQEELDSEGVDV